MRRWFLFTAKALVTIALLVLIATKTDPQRIFSVLQNINWILFLVALCVIGVQALIAVERWRRVLVYEEVQLPFFSLAQIFWFGLFFNQVMPSSIGGDAVRAYCLVRKGCTIGSASVSVLLDRMLGVMGVVLLVMVSFPASSQLVANEIMQWSIAVAVLTALGAVLGVLFLDRMTSRIRRWRFARGLGALSVSAKSLLFSTRLGVYLVLLSVAVQLLSVLALGLLATAISFDVSWIALLIVLPLATLVMTIPISVAGWGVREGVMVIGLGFAGADAEKTVVLSILFGVLVLLVALPGGLLWLTTDRPRVEKTESI